MWQEKKRDQLAYWDSQVLPGAPTGLSPRRGARRPARTLLDFSRVLCALRRSDPVPSLLIQRQGLHPADERVTVVRVEGGVLNQIHQEIRGLARHQRSECLIRRRRVSRNELQRRLVLSGRGAPARAVVPRRSKAKTCGFRGCKLAEQFADAVVRVAS